MKKILVVVFVVAIGLFAIQANAQVPYVQIYFDNTFKQIDKDCPVAPIGTVLDSIYVVAHNFNMWVSGIEYMIDYPVQVMFVGDVFEDGQLSIGSSPTGIGITWTIPANGYAGLLCQKARFIWMCDDCSPANQNAYWTVFPNPDSGLLRAVRWPDNVPVLGVGMRSAICFTFPAEESTWGGIKALYSE
jgi:hypothetical protein